MNTFNLKTMKTNYFNSNSNFMKTSKFFIAAIFCFTLITSCSDDDDIEEVLEEELITDVSLTFVNEANSGDTVVMTSVAPEGQDGAASQTVVGRFTAGATYSLTVGILNSEDPNDPEDVLNGDIIPAANEHFFVYAVNGINLTMTRDANDIAGPNGSKLGVNTTWVAGTATTGNVQIKLIHEPATADSAGGFGAATGGSEDINITFTGVVIQ